MTSLNNWGPSSTSFPRSSSISFSNCLDQSIIQSNNPQQLQFVPLYVDAKFDLENESHGLGITVYGNVTGQSTADTRSYPPPTDPIWGNKTDPFGKIVDATANFTTLFTQFDFLSYTPYNAQPARFCNTTRGSECPWGPLFGKNASDPQELHAFAVSHNMSSTYEFTTLFATMKIKSGDTGSPLVACVQVNVTPDLGPAMSGAFRWVPIVILGLVGIATFLAAKYHPSSSKNFFYWSSNYGRDEDLLRLLTPGFADCLQYIQFVVLSGSLSLAYPGFYQPVVSKVAWSTLTFNESFVSRGNGSQSLVDGIYRTNGTYGLSNLAQLVGMTTDSDIWPGMAVWLLVIVGSVVVLSQIGFVVHWGFRKYNKSEPQDLRSKNLPFTVGNVTRIVYNYLLLPIVSLSIFQLVVAGRSPGWEVALSLVVLVSIMGFAVWTFYLIFSANPRVKLFDHLPSLLMYGPLYNTYSDEAAPFALIPVFLNFVRGLAIGAVQPSGVAQLVILAICEIVFILTIHAFHPFQHMTSMNAYHTIFSVLRFLALLLSIAFVPSLDVDEGIKGWIGYAILFLHAAVLIFGFFLNAIQTLIEVFARMAGAGENPSGLARVFGVRQLSKRHERPHSLSSSAAMLDEGMKSPHNRLTSLSANSRLSSIDRLSQGYEGYSHGEDLSVRSGPSPSPSTPGTNQPNGFSFLPGPGEYQRRGSGSLSVPAPYYRPPRQRRTTLETATEGRSLELQATDGAAREPISVEPANDLRRNSIMSAAFRDESDADRRKQTDYYSSREADFLYGVQRGPALNNTPTRRRGTGPADPMHPISTATGWFKGLFGARSKEKGKGFEVVRSTPLHRLREQDGSLHPMIQEPLEPYTDGPTSPPKANPQPERGISMARPPPTRERSMSDDLLLPGGAPSLRPLSLGGSITLPERANARNTGGLKDMEPELVDTASGSPTRRTQLKDKNIFVERQPSFQRTSPYIDSAFPPNRVPFHSDYQGKQSENNSMTSSIYPPSIPPDDPFNPTRASGHFKAGQVSHHLAAESMHTYALNPSHMGSAAELVDSPSLDVPLADGTAAPKEPHYGNMI
ncbi:hypothetical protein BT63DRAFT_58197 [Microthyrium microscopicum]|uniref:ML-like domain-containing protein n=1 Tax=Microthyrium microscopicum TaxID=703497 RepID=A0A6A6U2R9_9PEZI|nr:hypothetical protein BT63DRAFT_58197 [Microthyrium microscopicum]